MSSVVKLNNDISIDLPKLIAGKLLVQANSGGGKSWLIRRIIEQAYGHVQIIVLDPEGEFSTLREKYDFVLAGKGGDTPADPKSAALLARKLLELKVSAIVDLYELHPQERKHFVRLFLDSMVNAPKELYHDVIVVLDEAHMFVPEKGESEAANAVIDMASRGRKRGYSLILATQRISKLHKDAAAECNNKLIGRTSLDIDRKRAADELGITSKEETLALRSLAPGEFFAFGPAISNEVIKVKVGDVKTSIPKAGTQMSVVPPTAGIKKILAKLADLPQEAAKEVATIQSLKAENIHLKRENQVLKNKQPEVIAPMATIQKAVEQALKNKQNDDIKFEQNVISENTKLRGILQNLVNQITKALSAPSITIGDRKPLSTYVPQIPPKQVLSHPVANTKRPEIRVIQRTVANEISPTDDLNPVKITGGALRMLKVLVSRHPIKLTRAQLATFSKMSPNSGTFGTYLSTLRSANYIADDRGSFSATDAGLEFVGDAPNPPQTTAEVIEMWKNNLSGGARRMFEALVQNHPQKMTREQLAEATEMSWTSGTFGTYMSILRSNGLIDTTGGEIGLSDSLFI